MKKQLAMGMLFILFYFPLIALSEQGLQSADSSFFKKGDRICFIGNSITNNGEFHHNIQLYFVTRFPDQPITFFNCGISGDVTQGILNRMDDDILVHRPTHAIIMIGMNDVKRSLYGSHGTSDRDTLRARASAIDTYKENLEKIVNIFISQNIKVILQKPSIYDQTAELPTQNNLGVNDALKTCADYMGVLASKYNLPTVDYWAIMSQINRELQEEDPTATIVGKDRVHPGPVGHFVMAYQFLESVGAPRYISNINIAKEKNKSTENCLNCELKTIYTHSAGASFSVKANALPLPIVVGQKQALDLVPFIDKFNTEWLRISHLKRGKYQLNIDGVPIGLFTHSQLKKGINLAEYDSTPQIQQAIKVLDVLRDLWQAESNLRSIKFIEYNQFFKMVPDKKDLLAVEKFLDSVFTEKYPQNSAYYKSQLDKYKINKPREQELKSQLERLENESYKAAQPEWHLFTISPLSRTKDKSINKK